MNISVNNQKSVIEDRKFPSMFGLHYTNAMIKSVYGILVTKLSIKLDNTSYLCLYIIPSHMNFSGSTSRRFVSLNSRGK